MKVYTVTRNNECYCDDVSMEQFLDTGDGEGTKAATKAFDDMIGWGTMDENRTCVDLWVFDLSTKETTHIMSRMVTDNEE